MSNLLALVLVIMGFCFVSIFVLVSKNKFAYQNVILPICLKDILLDLSLCGGLMLPTAKEDLERLFNDDRLSRTIVKWTECLKNCPFFADYLVLVVTYKLVPFYRGV